MCLVVISNAFFKHKLLLHLPRSLENKRSIHHGGTGRELGTRCVAKALPSFLV